MTRIRVDWEKLSLRAEGHAKAAPAGEDLACLGASVLTQALLNALIEAQERGRTRLKWKVFENDGILSLEANPYINHRAEIKAYFKVIVKGLKALEQNYPKNIKIIETGGMLNGGI